jgi:hypothetical protein
VQIRDRTLRGLTSLYTYGQPEEETTSQDVEAQTPQAPQSESPQEAHVAKISFAAILTFPPPKSGGFFLP